MTIESYSTIQKSSEATFKERGSKFIAIAFPVSDVDAFKKRLELIKKEHFSASHHCYAYRIGIDGNQVRANDDGEPGHTAGDPILNQIKSADLTNTAIVVVRYFGGTKLGKSGLIHAYKTAAAEALSSAFFVQRKIMVECRIKCTYETLSEVMKLINIYEIRILHQEYLETCHILIEMGVSEAEKLKASFMENPAVCQFKMLPGRS